MDKLRLRATLLERHHRTLEYATTDPEHALLEAGRIAEAICKAVFEQHVGCEPSANELEDLIKLLNQKVNPPAIISIHLRNIQWYRNHGAHDQGPPIAPSATTPCLAALDEVLHWFFERYLVAPPPSRSVQNSALFSLAELRDVTAPGAEPVAIGKTKIERRPVGPSPVSGREPLGGALDQPAIPAAPQSTFGAVVTRAEDLLAQGDVGTAVEMLTQLADRLKGAGDLDRFLRVAERVEYIWPGNRWLLRDLAEAYVDRRDARRALRAVDRWYRLEPENPEVLATLARTFELCGQDSKAALAWREAATALEEADEPEQARHAREEAGRLGEQADSVGGR